MENTTAQPNTSPASSPTVAKLGGSKKYLRILVIVAIVVLIGIVGYYLFNRFYNASSTATTQPVGQIQPLSGGEITLLTDKPSYAVGATIPVVVKISTGGYPTLGTDLVLTYDPNMLTVTGPASISNGDAYPDYQGKVIDQTAGMVGVSGISSATGNGFNGIGTFATINFVAKAAGNTTVKVDYSPNGTSDSNIIKLGEGGGASEDILNGVNNLNLVIN